MSEKASHKQLKKLKLFDYIKMYDDLTNPNTDIKDSKTWTFVMNELNRMDLVKGAKNKTAFEWQEVIIILISKYYILLLLAL